jgi:hypothetical protein
MGRCGQNRVGPLSYRPGKTSQRLFGTPLAPLRVGESNSRPHRPQGSRQYKDKSTNGQYRGRGATSANAVTTSGFPHETPEISRWLTFGGAPRIEQPGPLADETGGPNAPLQSVRSWLFDSWGGGTGRRPGVSTVGGCRGSD